MFFCRSDQKSCQKLQAILQKYERASGQKINQEKSSVTFSCKTPLETKNQAKQILNIHKEGGQGKYLGLPELFGRKKKDLFSLIVDRIKQRALSWSARFLSSAGKLTMLKSVLAAMPTYTMSCFHLPSSLCKRIQSALTRFWWDRNNEEKKMCWISWKRMTKSFKTGGLGFRDIQTFNKALLAKISWRLLTKSSCLLAKVLLGKYCKSSDFLDCSVSNSASHGWRSICLGRDLLKPQLGKIIGCGSSTPVWRSPWLSLTSPLSPFGPPTEASHNLKVSDLLIPGTCDWNKEVIRTTLPTYETDILNLRPSNLGAPDIWAWLPTQDGVYTAKSGYHEAYNDATPIDDPVPTHMAETFNWKTNIWSLKSSPKTKLFLWKAAQKALPVGLNLLKRQVNDLIKCPHCGDEESVEHLFFSCPFAKKIWELAPMKVPLNLSEIRSITDGITLANQLICLPPTGIGEGPLAPWIFWTIWTSRNQLIFSKKQFTEEETLLLAITRSKEWQSAQASLCHPNQTRNPMPKPLMPHNSLTCFTDASWKDNGMAGFGWVLQDSQDCLIREGSTTSSFVSSPLIAEAIATLVAVKVAVESGIKTISFASDSLVLVKALNLKIQKKELHGIQHDILHLSSNFSACSFIFVPRNCNLRADSLAKEAFLSPLCMAT